MTVIEQDWSQRPFRYRHITLRTLMKDFLWRRDQDWSLFKRNYDTIIDWCGESKSLTEAIQRACRSKRENGKHHNHQSKVPSIALRQLEQRLLRTQLIMKEFKTFARLYRWVDHRKPPGIGPVTTYDVANRIGAYLSLYPRQLYLHAGVLQGFKALVKCGYIPPTRNLIIEVEALPKALQDYKPDEVEDFLCAYRTIFPQLPPAT